MAANQPLGPPSHLPRLLWAALPTPTPFLFSPPNPLPSLPHFGRCPPSLPLPVALFPSLPAGGAGAGDVERYSDRFRQQLRTAEQVPLTSILTLDPRYFPEELFSTKQQMCVSRRA